MIIVPAPGWEELRQRLLGLKGSVLFLGRSDSGKSNLVKYLLGEVAAAGVTVALVDADLGQSFLALPGTVSRRTFHAPPVPHQMRWDEITFLGCVSPVRILSLLAEETGRMVARARQEATVTLIDTTGLVDGELGRALKLAKIRAVAPELIVAVAAGDELEPILSTVATDTVRIAPSSMVKPRSPEVRSRYRQARLAAYLHDAGEIMLATRRLIFMHHGVPINASFFLLEPGRVIGLNHKSETLALGVVVEAEADSLLVLTPLGTVRGIDRIVLGDFSFSKAEPPAPA
jgi:polynucleotide 5'-hydroxyl-kinase GRC3/NOL9